MISLSSVLNVARIEMERNKSDAKENRNSYGGLFLNFGGSEKEDYGVSI